MNTPFDGALRLRQREMDAMQVAISVQINQLTIIEEAREAVEQSVRREVKFAANNWSTSAHGFMARMRLQRETLLRDRAAVDVRLTSLRAKAAEAFGALRAVEGAAARYRAAANRIAAMAEQSRADDFSAARFSHRETSARRCRDTAGGDVT